MVLGLSVMAAYLAGSVNFAVLVLRMLRKGDPRGQFSGNAGTTNVYRIAGPFWAAVVLLLDMGRAAAVAVASLALLSSGQAPWVALGLLAGNRYPCFHGFSGGKGVGNYLGFTAVLAPWWAGASCVAWVALWAVVRRPFIASCLMIVVLGAGQVAWVRPSAGGTFAVFLACAFLFLNHRENFKGLSQEKARQGTPRNSGSRHP